nr:MAG TPA: hypothetical protein [Caudoviricetes sp.]
MFLHLSLNILQKLQNNQLIFLNALDLGYCFSI